MGKMKTTISAMRWYHWSGVAAVLFAIGVGALVVLGDGETATSEDGTSLLNLLRRPTSATGITHTLAYSVWLLSWLGAIVSIGIGVVRIRKASPKVD